MSVKQCILLSLRNIDGCSICTSPYYKVEWSEIPEKLLWESAFSFFFVPQNLALTFKPVCKVSILLWRLGFNGRIVCRMEMCCFWNACYFTIHIYKQFGNCAVRIWWVFRKTMIRKAFHLSPLSNISNFTMFVIFVSICFTPVIFSIFHSLLFATALCHLYPTDCLKKQQSFLALTCSWVSREQSLCCPLIYCHWFLFMAIMSIQIKN